MGLTCLVIAGALVLLGASWPAAVVLGGAVAMSSTALALKQLADQGEVSSEHGRRALAVLLFQDLAALPFLVMDVAAKWGLAYSLPVAVAFGGVIVGIWQAFLLRPHLPNTIWWVVGSAVGWPLAAATAAFADSLSHSLRGVWGAVAFLGVVAGGGLILGLVTGMPLVWLLRHKPAV